MLMNPANSAFVEPGETGFHPMFSDAPSSVEFNKLRKRLLRQTRQAIEDFAMVTPGQRWLVALSGGKDSYGLLALLLERGVPINTANKAGNTALHGSVSRGDAVVKLLLAHGAKVVKNNAGFTPIDIAMGAGGRGARGGVVRESTAALLRQASNQN